MKHPTQPHTHIIPSQLIPTITLTTITLTTWLAQQGFPSLSTPSSPFPHILTYHFFHANIYHLLLNLLALWLYRPRTATLITAYLTATLAAYIDSLITPAISTLYTGNSGFPPFTPNPPLPQFPTIGLSALIFAAFARNYVAWHRHTYPILIAIIITAPIPNLNWHLHLISFITSHIIWKAIYKTRALHFTPKPPKK